MQPKPFAFIPKSLVYNHTDITMKHISIHILLAVLLSMTLASCFSDETTYPDRPLSEITIVEGSVKSVYNIDKNQTLTITPQCMQSNTEKPLTYTWEIDQKVYSNEPVLTYVGNELGSWQCRLIVENEDGKTFFPFLLNVNSPYEEGITILSADAEGRPMLSFMQTPEGGGSASFYDHDCLSLNNSDTHFSSNPADIVQSGGRLIIACQGAETADDAPAIYYLNEKTMVVENILTVKEYPDFKPVMLGIPSMDAVGVAYPILCENGRVYEFSTTEGAIVSPSKLKYTYAQNMIVRDPGTGYNYEILMWDTEANTISMLYNGYGPYYCSKIYHATRENCKGTDNYFNGKQLAKMTYIRMTDEQARTADTQMLVVATMGAIIQKVTLSTALWLYNYDTAESYLADNGGVKTAGVGACPISPTTPTIANMTYYSMFYAAGNKVMRWNFTTSQFITASDVLLTVGSDNAVITGFEMSADHTKTYVTFYEPQQSGKNGSLWVFDTDSGAVLEKYDNICYRPVKIIYKKK